MVTTKTTPDGSRHTIAIGGRFDFKLHKEFREAYKNVGPATHLTVDLGQAEYMDSSALGMLLLLREHLGGNQAKVSIVNCAPEIKKILQIANFHKLFTMAA